MNAPVKRENKKRMQPKENGSVLVLVAVSMVFFFFMMSLALDLGWMVLTRNELQNAADASALAGAAQLIDEDILEGQPDQTDDIVMTRDYAELFAGQNSAAKRALLVDRNDANDENGGVVAGYIQDPLDLNSVLQTEGISIYNSVRVETRLAQEINGPLALFLGEFTGVDSVEMAARATATIDNRVAGFSINEDEMLQMLPFSLHEDVWDQGFEDFIACGPVDLTGQRPGGLVLGCFTMDFYMKLLGAIGCHITPGINIYPNDLDTPGNFGTIDIGPSNNSTDDICEQILYGITPEDIAIVGGLILSDEDGDGILSKWLEGDTGVSNAVKSAFYAILYETRILPLHRTVIGTGNGSQFEISRFAGVKIIEVHMYGALQDRYIKVEPVQIVAKEAVIDPEATAGELVYALSITQ